MLCLVTLQSLHKISLATHHGSTAVLWQTLKKNTLKIFLPLICSPVQALQPPPTPQLWVLRGPTHGTAQQLFSMDVINRRHIQHSQLMSINITEGNEKVLRDCTLAVVRWSQKFPSLRRPLPGGAGWPEFNQLEMVTTFTYKHSLVRIDAHNFELSW